MALIYIAAWNKRLDDLKKTLYKLEKGLIISNKRPLNRL